MWLKYSRIFLFYIYDFVHNVCNRVVLFGF